MGLLFFIHKMSLRLWNRIITSLHHHTICGRLWQSTRKPIKKNIYCDCITEMNDDLKMRTTSVLFWQQSKIDTIQSLHFSTSLPVSWQHVFFHSFSIYLVVTNWIWTLRYRYRPKAFYFQIEIRARKSDDVWNEMCHGHWTTFKTAQKNEKTKMGFLFHKWRKINETLAINFNGYFEIGRCCAHIFYLKPPQTQMKTRWFCCFSCIFLVWACVWSTGIYPAVLDQLYSWHKFEAHETSSLNSK